MASGKIHCNIYKAPTMEVLLEPTLVFTTEAIKNLVPQRKFSDYKRLIFAYGRSAGTRYDITELTFEAFHNLQYVPIMINDSNIMFAFMQSDTSTRVYYTQVGNTTFSYNVYFSIYGER